MYLSGKPSRMIQDARSLEDDTLPREVVHREPEMNQPADASGR